MSASTKIRFDALKNILDESHTTQSESFFTSSVLEVCDVIVREYHVESDNPNSVGMTFFAEADGLLVPSANMNSNENDMIQNDDVSVNTSSRLGDLPSVEGGYVPSEDSSLLGVEPMMQIVDDKIEEESQNTNVTKHK